MDTEPATEEDLEEVPAGLRFIFGFGRMVGFLLLAVPALVTIAAITLLPTYQNMMATLHERDVKLANVGTYQDYVAATEKMIGRLPEDEDTTRRLVMLQQRLLPRNEVVMIDPSEKPAPPPGVIVPERRPKPAAPSNMLLSMADKLKNPGTRRGLFLLAAGAMLAAMFLFAPADRYRQVKADETRT
ncbi:MAG: hypothetical protein ACE15C_03080 [Phycisphaerae bacterium]